MREELRKSLLPNISGIFLGVAASMIAAVIIYFINQETQERVQKLEQDNERQSAQFEETIRARDKDNALLREEISALQSKGFLQLDKERQAEREKIIEALKRYETVLFNQPLVKTVMEAERVSDYIPWSDSGATALQFDGATIRESVNAQCEIRLTDILLSPHFHRLGRELQDEILEFVDAASSDCYAYRISYENGTLGGFKSSLVYLSGFKYYGYGDSSFVSKFDDIVGRAHDIQRTIRSNIRELREEGKS